MLLMKEAVNLQISIRHFMHSFSSQLDHWEAMLSVAKNLAVEKQELKSLDAAEELLPAGAFTDCKSEFKQLTKRVDLLGESLEPYEKIINDCKIKYSEVILAMLSKLMKARGQSDSIDKFIDEVVPIVIPKQNVDDFVQMSNEQRNERLQALLESDRLTDWASVLRMSVNESQVLQQCKQVAEQNCNDAISRGTLNDEVVEQIIMESTEIVREELEFTIAETLSDKVAHNNDFLLAKRNVPRVADRTMHRIHSRLYNYVETYFAENAGL